MGQITINSKQLKGLQKRISAWATNGFEKNVKDASHDVTRTYKQQIKVGLDGADKPMRPVKEVTMGMPISLRRDSAKRQEVRSSRKPLVARGGAVNSLKTRKGSNKMIIEPSTQHGKNVFAANAFPKARGIQRTAPAKRDPLIVSEVQDKIIEKEILKGLDKAIRG